MTVRIVIREEIFLKGLPEELIKHFIAENSFDNPEIAKTLKTFDRYMDIAKAKNLPPEAAKKFKRYYYMAIGKINRLPKKLDLWRQKGDWLALPRGYEREALKLIRDWGIDFEIEDRTIKPQLSMAPLVPTGALFDYQEPPLREVLANPTGVISSPTGSGKTNMVLTMAAELQTPTLILVHTKGLLTQTMDRCAAWLDYEAGILGDGKSIIKDITVATIQTLQRMTINKDHPLYDRFGCVIVDECHHSPALTWSALLRSLPYRHKYGVTATAWRKDQLEFMIWRMISPITANVPVQTVIDAGRLVWPRVISIPTDYYFDMEDDDTSKWTQMLSDLISNEQRNWLIVRTLQQYAEADTKALILTDRVEHAKILAAMTEPMQPALVHGALGRKDRNAGMERIRAGVALTIATTSLMGEGIDVPGWDLLLLASPIAGGPRTIQAIGRITRPAPGKDRATLLDFVDGKVPVLQAAYFSRLSLYKNKGERKRRKHAR